MGKTKFSQTVYKPACDELYDGSAPTLKISHFSDPYQPGKNFAIVIMYGWNGEVTWFNKHKGYRGRFLYVAFSNTSEWTADRFREAGRGRVHNFTFKDTFGEEWSDRKACCAGASISEGKLKFSSAWLNDISSRDIGFKYKWES